MDVILCGSLGRMGGIFKKICESENCKVAAEVDIHSGEYCNISRVVGRFDCIIDFSAHTACESVCTYAQSYRLPVVIAVTGHSEDERVMIEKTAKTVPVFFSPNLSFGMYALCRYSAALAKLFPDADVEIIEKHHRGKVDAPSGSALKISECIRKERNGAYNVCGRYGHHLREMHEIGIHSLRCGNYPATHDVIIAGENERIVISHEVYDPKVFAVGAIRAAEFIIGKEPGLYGMDELMGDII
ncbi:MAG: 4-hydroxy-tetrahydrodipicolinate reductase [Eubacteriales bacterium]|nr:4-hydroxy-tetrahydrodipicolinate reductase [Eubacteriales bacterium]